MPKTVALTNGIKRFTDVFTGVVALFTREDFKPNGLASRR